MKIKKGDNVVVLTGKDKGKKGKVTRAFPSANQVLIEGVNVKKIHQRSRTQGKSGTIIESSRPLDVSNVAIVDPKTKKASRIGIKVTSGKKVRISKKSGSTLS